MIFGQTRVWTPKGWQEARLLQPGEAIYSWKWQGWVENRIEKIEESQSRSSVSVVALDGEPTVLRCTCDQKICVKRNKYVDAGHLASGAIVTGSEGANIFRLEASMVERADHETPEKTIGFKLLKQPRNFLASGFLCRA